MSWHINQLVWNRNYQFLKITGWIVCFGLITVTINSQSDGSAFSFQEFAVRCWHDFVQPFHHSTILHCRDMLTHQVSNLAFQIQSKAKQILQSQSACAISFQATWMNKKIRVLTSIVFWPRAFSILKYQLSQIWSCRYGIPTFMASKHDYELNADDQWHVFLDHKHIGSGGDDSWSPSVLEVKHFTCNIKEWPGVHWNSILLIYYYYMQYIARDTRTSLWLIKFLNCGPVMREWSYLSLTGFYLTAAIRAHQACKCLVVPCGGILIRSQAGREWHTFCTANLGFNYMARSFVTTWPQSLTLRSETHVS